MSRYIDVHLVASSEQEAVLIAESLVERRLAACVFMFPIRSFYYWENHLCDDSEYLLIAKTKDHLFQTQIVPVVRSLHSYEVSEILALPIVDGDPDFLNWIEQQILGESET